MRPIAAAERPPSARGLAKAAGSVQPRRSSKLRKDKGKAAGFVRRLLEAARVGETALAVVRYCGCTLLRLCVAALHHPARTSVVPATETITTTETAAVSRAAIPAAEPRERDKSVLLAVIEALVERAGRIGEFFEAGSALTH